MKEQIEEKIEALGGVVPVGSEFTPLADEELAAVEAECGAPLPLDYREFLQRYGASGFAKLVEFVLLQPDPVHPVESLLGVPIPRYEIAPFSHFYGARSAGINGLLGTIAAYRGRIPDTLIPIGDDGGGHQICLGIKGMEQGKVYYWDHENEWDEEDYLEDYGVPMPPEVKFQNVYLAAYSFADFFQRLHNVTGKTSAGRRAE